MKDEARPGRRRTTPSKAVDSWGAIGRIATTLATSTDHGRESGPTGFASRAPKSVGKAVKHDEESTSGPAHDLEVLSLLIDHLSSANDVAAAKEKQKALGGLAALLAKAYDQFAADLRWLVARARQLQDGSRPGYDTMRPAAKAHMAMLARIGAEVPLVIGRPSGPWTLGEEADAMIATLRDLAMRYETDARFIRRDHIKKRGRPKSADNIEPATRFQITPVVKRKAGHPQRQDLGISNEDLAKRVDEILQARGGPAVGACRLIAKEHLRLSAKKIPAAAKLLAERYSRHQRALREGKSGPN